MPRRRPVNTHASDNHRKAASKSQRTAAPGDHQRQVSAAADFEPPKLNGGSQSAADIGRASPIDRAWPIVSVQKRAMKLPMGAMGPTADSQRLPRAFGTARLLVQLRNRPTDADAARMLVG